MGSKQVDENLGVFQDLKMFFNSYLWLVCLDYRL